MHIIHYSSEHFYPYVFHSLCNIIHIAYSLFICQYFFISVISFRYIQYTINISTLFLISARKKSCTRIHSFLYSLDIMPATGIEPVWEYKSRRILSPVRLPVPPHRRGARQSRRIVNTYDFLWRSLSVSNAVTVM